MDNTTGLNYLTGICLTVQIMTVKTGLKFMERKNQYYFLMNL